MGLYIYIYIYMKVIEYIRGWQWIALFTVAPSSRKSTVMGFLFMNTVSIILFIVLCIRNFFFTKKIRVLPLYGQYFHGNFLVKTPFYLICNDLFTKIFFSVHITFFFCNLSRITLVSYHKLAEIHLFFQTIIFRFDFLPFGIASKQTSFCEI